jgi:hypothetical protein
VQQKRPSDSDASVPPAKKKRQLPPGYGDNNDYVPPKYERDEAYTDRSAPFATGSRPVLAKSTYTAPPPKKVAPVFLSQEQTHVLKLAQEGKSLFYTGSAGQYSRLHSRASTSLIHSIFRNRKICTSPGNHQGAEEEAYQDE